MLIAGEGQEYRDSSAINFPVSTFVGDGIYCAPHIQDSLDYTQDY